jgi:hypothetical protein
MILQAQAITPRGLVLAIENRDVHTPAEAEEFRRDFERITNRTPQEVRVVSVCGRLAHRPLAEAAQGAADPGSLSYLLS